MILKPSMSIRKLPPVLIESIILERDPIDFQNGITIQPGQRGQEISYTGPNLSHYRMFIVTAAARVYYCRRLSSPLTPAAFTTAKEQT